MPALPGPLPSIAEARHESRTPSPPSNAQGGSWHGAVRGFFSRLTGSSAEERYGLLGASTINDSEYIGSFARSINWKTWGIAAAFLFLFSLFIGAISVALTQGSSTGGRGWSFGPRVEIGSPTTPNNRRFHADGCPALDPPSPGRRYLQIVNNCDETIWPGISPPGAVGMPPGGWAWEAKECKTLEVSSQLPSLRIWGRTGCDSSFKCITGTCMVDGGGGCQSAGEAPCSLWEATLQDHCTETPMVGLGPDFYDSSLVDGFNLPISSHVSGGFNVGGTEAAYSCQSPRVEPFDYSRCPYELRVYADQIPGTTLPVEGIMGVNTVVSPCFETPLEKHCQSQVVGCRSLCKSMDQGWIGHYIDHVKGDPEVVDPIVTRPAYQGTMRWSQQFLQGRSKCGDDLCKGVRAWGAFRGEAYAGGGTMKNLVCCDFGFRCSPYQPNNVPGGCPYNQACPSLGAADPHSAYHSRAAQDLTYPQADEAIRKSSSLPDWPLASNGMNYAAIYKESSPSAYSWQYNDFSSTFVCCGADGEPGPGYVISFCPQGSGDTNLDTADTPRKTRRKGKHNRD